MNQLKYKLPALVLATFMVLTTGCSTEVSYPEESGRSLPVYVTVTPAQTLMSRADEDIIQVTEGEYYISYPQSSTKTYGLGTVDFTLSQTPGIGIVLLPGNQEMKWDNVEGSNPIFYLDNVEPGDASASDPLNVTFTDEYSPFNAGVYNGDEGSNDLLWSTLQVNSNTRTLNFELHHNMARLQVEITVDKTFETENQKLDMTNAIVEISSINQVPLSFNRQTGDLKLSTEEEDYTTLTLVGGGSNIDWASVTQDPTDENVTVYATPNFVLPPQELLTNTNRPRLTITLNNEDGTQRTFSGIIPYAMNVYTQQYPNGYPVTLSFLKEYILTLRTLISNDPPELSFMPVKVVEWVDKGSYDVDGHQAGIYLASEFTQLIQYYRSNNEFQLYRYGNLNEETNSWTFNIWAPLNLNYNDISGGMSGGSSDFIFNYNGYSVTVTNGSVSKNVSAAQLVGILKGTLTFENLN